MHSNPSTSICALTCWNIDGLKNKITDDLFYSKISFYDIVGLVETWAHDENQCTEIINNGLQDFNYIFVPAIGECTVGRKSGGIILLFRKLLQNAIKIISVNSSVVWIKLSKTYFGWDRDLYLATVYIPPPTSKYYSDHYTTLENDIAMYSNLGDVKLMGDFNARLGTLQDYVIDDSDKHLALPPDYCPDSQKHRRNVDTKVNSHGKNLISMCMATQLRILNGRTPGDTLGNFTYHDPRGSSAIDYFLCCESFRSRIWGVQIHSLTYLSRHCQISCFLKCRKIPPVKKKNILQTPCPPAIRFLKTDIDAYQSTLLSPQSINAISNFMTRDIDSTQLGIDQALKDLTYTIHQAGTSVHPMQTYPKRRKSKRKPNRPYFDSNCKAARNIVNKLGKSLSKTPWQADLRHEYNFQKKQYKKLIKKQYRDFKQNLVNKLNDLDPTDTKELWAILDKLGNIDSPLKNNSGLDHSDLLDHFQSLNQHNHEAPSDLHYVQELEKMERQNVINNPKISSPTNFKEIKEILCSLKNNKASGPDQIPNELLKYGTNALLSPITKLFNKILETEIVPKQWSHGFIVPIQKSGSKPTAENQRGLTILCTLGKVFTKLINSRIVTFLEDNNILSEVQAGFRKDHRTTDNIFILKSLIDKYVKNGKKKLYLGFIDFQKAFDNVWHPGLLYKLQLNGIVGNIYNIIKNLYAGVTLQVKHDNQLSSTFTSNNGVRQGDNLSPTLFNIFVNDLQFDPTTSAPVTLHTKLLTHLLYADDLLIISESPEGLQSSFNQLDSYCNKWHLHINPAKSQVMVIRNCPRPISYNFTIGPTDIAQCTKYRYLGLLISEDGTFTQAADELKAKASKALYKLKQITAKCSFPVKLQLKLFDSLVKPILLYNSEIWGLHTKYLNSDKEPDYWLDLKRLDPSPFELFHHKFCKNILRLPLQTTNMMCKAELGRFPIIFDILLTSVKYQHRLHTTKNSTLRDAYEYYIHAPSTIHNWKSNLQKFTTAANIAIPSTTQSLSKAQLKHFITPIKTDLENQYKQYFFSYINKSDSSGKFTLYQKVYNDYKLQTYLSLAHAKHKQTISKLRTSTHKLQIEIGRHQKINREDRVCQYCTMNVTEDEAHFLLYCPSLTDQRKILFDSLAMTVNQPPMMDHDLLRLLLNPTTLDTNFPTVSSHIYSMYFSRLNLPTAHSQGNSCT